MPIISVYSTSSWLIKYSCTSQAVASIVGRADLLCGLLAVAALSLTVGGVNSRPKSRDRGQFELIIKEREFWRTSGQRNRRSEATDEEKIKQKLQDGDCAIRANCTVTDVVSMDTRSETSNGKTWLVSSENTPRTGEKQDIFIQNEEKGTYFMHSAERCSDGGVLRTDLVGEPRGASVLRSAVALSLAIAATLCKEVGATVFLLIAGAELVLFLEMSGCGRKYSAGATASGDSCE